MDMQLAGKAAVVTGGSKGIGLAVVRQLLDEGVRVVAASRRNTPELKETAALHVPVDLTTAEGAMDLIERATVELGGIDILVNNVGVGDADDAVRSAMLTLLDLPDSDWQQSFDLHFYSALRVTRAALPSLLERQGIVVNVSSIAARLAGLGPASYTASKAALNALTKLVAEQFGAKGVRAITVTPGPVSTGVFVDPDGTMARLAAAQGLARDEFVDQMMGQLGAYTGRISTPEEVARLIVFAASPNNISGSEYLIDGGIVKSA